MSAATLVGSQIGPLKAVAAPTYTKPKPHPLLEASKVSATLEQIYATLDSKPAPKSWGLVMGVLDCALELTRLDIKQCDEVDKILLGVVVERIQIQALIILRRLNETVLPKFVCPATMKKPEKGNGRPPTETADCFEITFQSRRIKNLEEAQFFLIGENHNNEEGRKLAARFIGERAGSEAICLVEGNSSSMGVIDSKMDPEVIHKVMGPRIAFSEKTRWFVTGWDFPESDRLQKAVFGKNDKVQLAIEDVKKQHSELMASDLTGEERSRKVKKNVDKIARLTRLELYNDSTTESIRVTFRERTRSMINNLQRVQNWILETGFQGEVFLIAGVAHLKALKDRKNKPDYSLVELYEALEQLPAAVLIPKLLNCE
jgi:hypothetical protein